MLHTVSVVLMRRHFELHSSVAQNSEYRITRVQSVLNESCLLSLTVHCFAYGAYRHLVTIYMHLIPSWIQEAHAARVVLTLPQLSLWL